MRAVHWKVGGDTRAHADKDTEPDFDFRLTPLFVSCNDKARLNIQEFGVSRARKRVEVRSGPRSYADDATRVCALLRHTSYADDQIRECTILLAGYTISRSLILHSVKTILQILGYPSAGALSGRGHVKQAVPPCDRMMSTQQ